MNQPINQKLAELLVEVDVEGSSRKEHSFDNGFTLEIAGPERRDEVRIVAPNGMLCLKIHMEQDGPRIEVAGQDLRVQAQGDLHFDCARFEVNASSEVALRSGGDITQEARGDLNLRAQGDLKSAAFAQEIRATRGDIQVIANDDVRIDGETVNLNNPRAYLRSASGMSTLKA
jgi:hypothetical protein